MNKALEILTIIGGTKIFVHRIVKLYGSIIFIVI